MGSMGLFPYFTEIIGKILPLGFRISNFKQDFSICVKDFSLLLTPHSTLKIVTLLDRLFFLIFGWCNTYGTARFKLYKHSRVPYTRHYTSQKIFVACLRALGKVMTSPPLVASKHTCYKLVTSLSTRARSVNALDTCNTRNQLERVFVCIYACIYLITRWECYSPSQNKNNTCSDAISLFSGKEQNHGSRA